MREIDEYINNIIQITGSFHFTRKAFFFLLNALFLPIPLFFTKAIFFIIKPYFFY